MTRVFDNIDLMVKDALNSALGTFDSMDACVGYFNLRGWNVLQNAVAEGPSSPERPRLRLLIGMQGRTDRDELREALHIFGSTGLVDNATALRLKTAALEELRHQLELGRPSDRDQAVLRNLRAQLAADRVKVKLHLRFNLHAKLYLCHRVDMATPRLGLVGSSNFTFAGLGRQGEMNVDVTDTDATEKLKKWFNERWTDAMSLDITDELIAIIDESWASESDVEPYLIHLKLAYHLSRDARAGLVEFGLPASMQQQLLQFQAAAVRITARNLIVHGGAMVGDVVGLGKTMVATAVALLLEESHGFETLIICPRNLVTMWQGYVDNFRLRAKVVSLSMVAQELDGLRRYRLVIIDESHNLRNPKRIDYGHIRTYIQQNDPRVLLLTATPFNTSMDDVASQLGLFLDDDQDLGIRPEAEIAKRGETEFLRRCDDKPATLRAFRLSTEDVDWQQLLAQFLIRRTRRFIKDNYAELDEDNGRLFLSFESGARHYLPDRVPLPLPFEAEADDPAGDMASDDVLDTIDALRLPRYQLVNYLKDDLPTLLPDEQQLIGAVQRAGGNLVGFTRTMLMKRLSSSGAVFLLSLQRHLLRNCIYVHAIEQGLSLPVGTVTDSQVMDEEELLTIPVSPEEDDRLDEVLSLFDQLDEEADTEDEDERPVERHMALMKRLAARALEILTVRTPPNVRWARAELFTEALLDSLRGDNEVLIEMLERFGAWDQNRDSKLDSLEELLRTTHPTEKVLIFTEYADTARYISDVLQARGIEKVGLVTGHTENPTTLAWRFSPNTNPMVNGLPSPEDELRVLVATDVLSEGQNLQDCAIVVNFDLPWAIIKLIQRAGRVDRIGQRAEQVLVYTFLPQSGVEGVLRLRQRVADRLARNAAVFGADEQFFGSAEEQRVIEGLFDENSQLDDAIEVEEVDYASAAYEIWRQAEESHADLARLATELPDVTYATLGADAEHPAGVLVYTLSKFGLDRLGFCPGGGELTPVRVSPLDALRRTACDPSTPSRAPMSNHFTLLDAVLDGPLSPDETTSEGTMTGIRRRVYDKVRDLVQGSDDRLFELHPGGRAALDALVRLPLTEEAKQQLARSMRERTNEDLLALLIQLNDENRLSVDVTVQSDEVHVVCSMGFAP